MYICFKLLQSFSGQILAKIYLNIDLKIRYDAISKSIPIPLQLTSFFLSNSRPTTTKIPFIIFFFYSYFTSELITIIFFYYKRNLTKKSFEMQNDTLLHILLIRLNMHTFLHIYNIYTKIFSKSHFVTHAHHFELLSQRS